MNERYDALAAQRRRRYDAFWNRKRWQPGVWVLNYTDRQYTVSIEDAEAVHFTNRTLSNMRNRPSHMGNAHRK